MIGLAFIIETAIVYSAVIWVMISWLKLALKLLNFELNKYTSKLTCAKCVTFWVVLILTWSVPAAAVSALLAAMIDIYFNSKEIQL